MATITRVLVANRGEIAVRVITTLRKMGIASVAVYSDADADAPHVHAADVAVRIGPTPAVESYLNIDRVIEAARRTGADAIHPGYGFLSENVEFAKACEQAGIVFIGPPVAAIEAMGDKIRAKATAIEAGVPVVPGRHDPQMDDDTIIEAAHEIGFPVLLKPSAGGGGKGMRIVESADQLPEAITSARREATGSFGDDTLLIEKFVTRPRHIEVQVFGDSHGHVVHLGERECSLQRRHQKVIEEAPSILLDPATRQRLCESAVRLAEAVGYVGAGTVEYVVPSDDPGQFAFLEMNTRLQVEHPVTEMVTGVDLVEWQVRVAAGEPLPLQQDQIALDGHAVEARVYAEDAQRGFIPTGGDVLALDFPLDARVDSGIALGSSIGSAYDPMLAKVIVHATDRETALGRLSESLARTVILGLRTNVDYLRFLVDTPEVRSGDLDTALIERLGTPAAMPPSLHALAAVAVAEHPGASGGGQGFAATDGWRIGGRSPWRADLHYETPGAETAALSPTLIAAFTAPDSLVVDDVECRVEAHPHGSGMLIDVDGVSELAHTVGDGGYRWVHTVIDGTVRLGVTPPIQRRLRGAGEGGLSGTWAARSPMPGTIVAIPVELGAQVEAGDPIVVVEAMKMEHTLRAPAAGKVSTVRVQVGAQVKLDDELVEIEMSEAEAGEEAS